MSSIVRVCNIFTQIKNNLDGENNILGQILLKKVFKVENDDDLNYLKPYIFQEIDNCESEMLSNNFTSEQILNTVPNFKKYLNDSIITPSIPDYSKAPLIHSINSAMVENANAKRFLISQSNIDRILYEDVYKKQFPKDSLTNLSFAARPFQKSFPKNGYDEQIEKIKGEVASLKNEFLQLNKVDDYVYSFILLNLDRIDILLNNFDKIAPKYIEFNLYAIITPVWAIKEYRGLMKSVKSLCKQIFNFTNTYGGCVCTVYTLADITGKLLLKTP